MADTFRVATWNMGGGEKVGPSDGEVRELLAELRASRCSILLGQEAQERHDLAVLAELGYLFHQTEPESVVAWLPEEWVEVARFDETLTQTPYFRPGSTRPVLVKAARVILCDRVGRSLEVLSYHLPSSVQKADPSERRMVALREAMRSLATIAEQSHTRAVLFGGDDNVDEDGPHGPWRFMRAAETGLRQVPAPKPTLGSRRVDDFRIRGLATVGAGRVVQGPTHHNAHVQRLRWRKREAQS